MTDVVGRGLVRETIGASDAELRLRGLVREAVVVGATPLHHVLVQGLARETVLAPAVAVTGARQYAVSVIS